MCEQILCSYTRLVNLVGPRILDLDSFSLDFWCWCCVVFLASSSAVEKSDGILIPLLCDLFLSLEDLTIPSQCSKISLAWVFCCALHLVDTLVWKYASSVLGNFLVFFSLSFPLYIPETLIVGF